MSLSWSGGSVARLVAVFLVLIAQSAWAQDEDDEEGPGFLYELAVVTEVDPPEAGTLVCTPNPVQQYTNVECTFTPAPGYNVLGFEVLGMFRGIIDFENQGCIRSGNTCRAYMRQFINNYARVRVRAALGFVHEISLHEVFSPPDPYWWPQIVTCSAERVVDGGTVTCAPVNTQYRYQWARWGGDCAGSAEVCVLSNVRGPKSVVSFNEERATIATSASPANAGTVVCVPNPVVVGGTSNCTATPAEGYALKGFRGACSGIACVIPSVARSASVEAEFVPVIPPTVEAVPPGSGTVHCSIGIMNGESLFTCVARPAAGFSYSGITSGCFALPCTFSAASPGVRITAHFSPLAPLNDTGLDRCYDPKTESPQVCTSGLAGPRAPAFALQDGRFGRDARALAGKLTKAGSGRAGFDWSKVARSGAVLSDAAARGAEPTAWACVRDHVTGLDWLVKTRDGSVHDGSGRLTFNETQAAIEATNSVSMCAAQGWRLPTVQELLSILNFGQSSGLVDGDWFPDMPDAVWTRHAMPDMASNWQRGFLPYRGLHQRFTHSDRLGFVLVRTAR